MHEIKEDIEKLSEMLKTAECSLKDVIERGFINPSCITGEDVPKLVDIVKDLSEARKDCAKACYYEKVVEAMETGESEMEPYAALAKIMGYNNRRYANGEYAPKGKGHISGFMPMWDDMPHLRPHAMYDGDHETMGYPRMPRIGRSQTGDDFRTTYGYDEDRYWDETLADYDKSRKHYHESGSESDRMEMGEKGMKHAKKSLDTIREIWDDADPAMRKKLKAEMSAAVSEMVV